MASINSESSTVLRSSTNTSVSGRCVWALREGFWEQDQPITLSWNGCQSGQRNRQFVCFCICISADWNMTLAISLFTDPQVHLAFLTSLLSRIDTKTSKEAHVLLLASIAHAKLLYGDLEGTKSDMDAAWKILDTLEGVDNGVNAAYYGVGAYYYKVGFFLVPISCVLISFIYFLRQKQNMHLTIGILSCILLVWIWKKICHQRNGWVAHMILASLHSLVTLSIILGSWWVTYDEP